MVGLGQREGGREGGKVTDSTDAIELGSTGSSVTIEYAIYFCYHRFGPTYRGLQ